MYSTSDTKCYDRFNYQMQTVIKDIILPTSCINRFDKNLLLFTSFAMVHL